MAQRDPTIKMHITYSPIRASHLHTYDMKENLYVAVARQHLPLTPQAVHEKENSNHV